MHLMFILYFLVTSEERDVEKKKKQVNTNQTHLSKQTETYKDVSDVLTTLFGFLLAYAAISARSKTRERLGS